MELKNFKLELLRYCGILKGSMDIVKLCPSMKGQAV